MAPNGTLPSSHVDISLPVNRATEPGNWTPEIDTTLHAREASNVQLKGPNALALEFFPHGRRSLSGIAVRAFSLGGTAVLGFVLTALLAYQGSHLWRPCLFLGALSVFHFLEFYTTAAYNTPIAHVSSFLLTNGAQYRQAHSLALVETCITSFFFADWQSRINPPPMIALGLLLIAVGQAVRSTAMAQAGTNFNHTVQSRKNDGHELVTTGLYAHLRHPSYFGFFWWGIGTQVMLGNSFCFLAYAGILWYFFMRRISHEEKHLVDFFGDDYATYRARTGVWIPFIR